MCNCALCGEFLTQPYLHNGKPYGWSCINKVLPEGQKAKKADCKKLPEDIVKSLFKDADSSRTISAPRMITKIHPENNQVIQHQWIRITVSKPACKEMIYDFPIIRYSRQVNTAENVNGVWFFTKPKTF